ncbi:MAG: hypothetical protein WCG87_12545 [Bacteroidota bacterium]
MKNLSISIVLFTCLITGCKSLGEHFNCMDEVDRTVPAKTLQNYVRTDTKCSSTGSGIATPTTTRGDQYVVNTDRQTNCTSTPVYETVILNQPERDAAYQRCRNRIAANNSAAASPPPRAQKLSPSTPLCQALAKSDGLNGAVYKSQCN